MKITVLVDNNTYIDHYFFGEPGLSYFIEDEGVNILFDAGYSDAFIKNANKMNIDLNNINSVVISHGHMDHTWGLFYLIKLYTEAALETIDFNKPNIIAHPLSFIDRSLPNCIEIGSIITEDKLNKHFNMMLSKEPIWITEKLVFLGEIERNNDFENKMPIGQTRENGNFEPDYIMDDSALVYKSKKGLVIITGCSHSGICNIIEYAKKVCKCHRIADIIGGFHLLNPPEDVLKETIKHIKLNNIEKIHPCHCTDLQSKIELSKVTNVNEVGVGLSLLYE